MTLLESAIASHPDLLEATGGGVSSGAAGGVSSGAGAQQQARFRCVEDDVVRVVAIALGVRGQQATLCCMRSMKNEQLRHYKIFDGLDDDQLNKFHSVMVKEKVDSGKRFNIR